MEEYTTLEIREKVLEKLRSAGVNISSSTPAFRLYRELCSLVGEDATTSKSKKWYYKKMYSMLCTTYVPTKERILVKGSYLVSKKQGNKAHLWMGSDTACRLFSTGGMGQNNYSVAEYTSSDICKTCIKMKSSRKINERKIAPIKKQPLPQIKYVPSDIFFSSDEWRTLRYRALEAQSGACQCCGRSRKVHGVVLHVDHIKPRSKFPELALELDNLQILCADCNLGKSNKFATDWR